MQKNTSPVNVAYSFFCNIATGLPERTHKEPILFFQQSTLNIITFEKAAGNPQYGNAYY